MTNDSSIDMVHYLDKHFATEDWLTQDVWFQIRKRLKDQEDTSDKDVPEK